jgi:hypothetical protein
LPKPQRWASRPTGLACVYLNDSGSSAESIDNNSGQGECWGNGGFWADGNVGDASWVQTFSNSDNILINSNVDGFLATTMAGSTNDGGTAFSQMFGIDSPVQDIMGSTPSSLPTDVPLSTSGQAAANAISLAFRNFPNVCGVGGALYFGKGKVGAGISADTQNGVKFASGVNLLTLGPVKANYTISGGANGSISYALQTGLGFGPEVGTQNGSLRSIQSFSMSSNSGGWKNVSLYANISNMGDPNCK